MLKHAVPVFGGKVGAVQVYADTVSDGLGICKVSLGRAVFGVVILIPVLHEQALNLVALLLK